MRPSAWVAMYRAVRAASFAHFLSDASMRRRDAILPTAVPLAGCSDYCAQLGRRRRCSNDTRRA